MSCDGTRGRPITGRTVATGLCHPSLNPIATIQFQFNRKLKGSSSSLSPLFFNFFFNKAKTQSQTRRHTANRTNASAGNFKQTKKKKTNECHQIPLLTPATSYSWQCHVGLAFPQTRPAVCPQTIIAPMNFEKSLIIWLHSFHSIETQFNLNVINRISFQH